MIFVYHDYIAPLFDKYTPLPEGELKLAIENLASSLKFPLKKLLVVEGSKRLAVELCSLFLCFNAAFSNLRSAHSNAYFYGFWKNKRIVLFDTLLEEGIMPAKTETAADSDENNESVETEEKSQPSLDDAGSSPTESNKSKDVADKKHKGCNQEEILAVLAHELGHWKLSHNLKNLTIGEVRDCLSVV